MLMPNFFKEFPKNKKEEGVYKLTVYQLFMFRKDEIIVKEEYKGKLWKAYVKVRFMALFKDLNTRGSESGIAWGIDKVDGKSEQNILGFCLE